jgi:hypothetical protein
MVLIGSSFIAGRETREYSCTQSLLGLMKAPSFGIPVAVTAFGVLTNKSLKKFVPFNPNDEGECVNGCVSSQWD